MVIIPVNMNSSLSFSFILSLYGNFDKDVLMIHFSLFLNPFFMHLTEGGTASHLIGPCSRSRSANLARLQVDDFALLPHVFYTIKDRGIR